MRTEREIRQHVADLELIYSQPCNCAATSHAASCVEAKRAIRGIIMALRWAAGDDSPEQANRIAVARDLCLDIQSGSN